MSSFDLCFGILVGHEGGYVNDPRDRGGETKFGISKRAYPKVDIATLTLDDAKAIYHRDYWTPLHADQLPAALRLLAFDAAVNCGVGRAVRWLQSAAKVRVDGVLGPVSIAALQAPGIEARFHMERVVAMTESSDWHVFGKGWCVRLATLPFQALALHE